ncbi:hypothetical protein SCLCIDRAFT_12698 [Scleroderma citrinum Foug A]|uniref:25S rRNA (uridine-N(3))-methyltransferase BMT5-like domain-containing protein n=1 Tax=Scleroderma citrinum Foug A TaxID=1036808 RepID=A0A0C3A8T8_9AGAM|nr:hypothetical protein SCLCIDRAFT_12698 [Scleroderma citrinum Foug A]
MSKIQKVSLKATLQSQQSRLKAKKKADHAAQVAEQKGKRKPPNAKGKSNPLHTIPFRPTDKILLIGEGNFSFARALLVHPPAALEHLPAAGVTATSYDSEEDCYAKYSNAREIVEILRNRGAEVVFDVDATKLHKYPAFKGRRWDRIVWNFPHAGKGITDQDRNILSNQQLILDFLRSSPSCLTLGLVPSVHRKRPHNMPDDDDEKDMDIIPDLDAEDSLPSTALGSGRGTILITLRNVPPYTTWDVPRLAKTPPKPSRTGETPNPRFKLLRSFVFHRSLWKGYEHRMTKGERAHGQGTTGVGGEDRTWEFCLQD